MSHKKRDWSKYNKSLVNRGSLTLWVDPKTLKLWKAKRSKNVGRPFKYSDVAITTAATIRYALKLTLRTCEGFLRSLFELLKLDHDVPSYTQICKRMKKLVLPSNFFTDKPVRHIVLDATGLKVFGEGEWKVKKHGTSTRRRWCKLHIAVDEQTQDVLFVDLTKEHESDTKCIPEILENRKGMKRLLMDGAADAVWIYQLLWEQGVDLLTPPQKNAKIRDEPWMKARTNRLLEILGLGGDKAAKSLWGKLSGYSKRVTVESAIARWKRLFGPYLLSRSRKNQELEVRLKALIMNKMKNLSLCHL